MVYAASTWGRGLGNVHSYQTLGALLVYPQKDFEHFADLRIHSLNHGEWASNCGIGIRRFSQAYNTVVGLNAFYDYRDSYGSFHQGGIGFEMFGPRWNLYANWYFPSGKKSRFGISQTDDYPGGYVATSVPCVMSMTGCDVEVGTHSYQWLSPSSFSVYIGLGGYHYHKKNCVSSLTGFRYCVEGSYSNWIFMGFVGTTDPVFQNTFQGYLSISISFDRFGFYFKKNAYSQSNTWDQIKSRPIQRHPIIVETPPCCQWETNF